MDAFNIIERLLSKIGDIIEFKIKEEAQEEARQILINLKEAFSNVRQQVEKMQFDFSETDNAVDTELMEKFPLHATSQE